MEDYKDYLRFKNALINAAVNAAINPSDAITDNVQSDTIKISKKALKERSYAQTFTGYGVKINVLWFDRNEGEYKENGIVKRFAGYRFMVATMLTKEQTLTCLHHWMTTGEQWIDRNVKFWVAENDKARRKPPLQLNWHTL
jgi:hypothetical protein